VAAKSPDRNASEIALLINASSLDAALDAHGWESKKQQTAGSLSKSLQ
jgi:hypothetical protein